MSDVDDRPAENNAPAGAAAQAAFDAYAADYDAALAEGLSASGEDKEFFARGRIAWLKRCLDQMHIRPQSIMDFGCGTGSATPFLQQAFPQAQIVGIDVSRASLAVARKQYGSANVRFALMDESVPDGRVNLVYCNGVFHHIPPHERPKTIDYVVRSLSPNGIFALWENNPWNPGTRYIMSRIPFDRDAITLSVNESRRILSAGGLTVLRSDFLFYFPRILAWLRPLERALVKLPLGGQYLVLAQKRH